MTNRICGSFLQMKGWQIFKKKVGIHGDLKIGNLTDFAIGDHCGISQRFNILDHHRIEIGSRLALSARCMLIDAGLDKTQFAISNFLRHLSALIINKDGAWIGEGSILLANVNVGRRAIVGAVAFVTRHVLDHAIAAGKPAQVIGSTNE